MQVTKVTSEIGLNDLLAKVLPYVTGPNGEKAERINTYSSSGAKPTYMVDFPHPYGTVHGYSRVTGIISNAEFMTALNEYMATVKYKATRMEVRDSTISLELEALSSVPDPEPQKLPF